MPAPESVVLRVSLGNVQRGGACDFLLSRVTALLW